MKSDFSAWIKAGNRCVCVVHHPLLRLNSASLSHVCRALSDSQRHNFGKSKYVQCTYMRTYSDVQCTYMLLPKYVVHCFHCWENQVTHFRTWRVSSRLLLDQSIGLLTDFCKGEERVCVEGLKSCAETE
jgi:hypothetical protein